mgnify:CR=1 FL=1
MKIIFKALLLLGLITFIYFPTKNTLAQVKADIGGYGQVWGIVTDKVESDSDGVIREVNGYRLRRGRLYARTRINEMFSATVWLELSTPDRALLDYYFDVHLKPWLNIRAGQFIMSGQTHDTARLFSSLLLFHERAPITTQLSSIMGFNAFRDIGVMAYGSHGRLWYGIHAGNGTGRFTNAGTNITQRKTGDGLYGIRLDYEIVDGITLGGHASMNRQNDLIIGSNAPVDVDRTSYSLRLATDGFGIDRLFTQIEYAAGKQNDTQVFDFDGYYAQVGYKMTPDFYFMIRKEQFRRVPEAGPRYKDDSITLGGLYFFKQNDREVARLGLNYQFGKIKPLNADTSLILAWLQVRF